MYFSLTIDKRFNRPAILNKDWNRLFILTQEYECAISSRYFDI